MHDGWRQSGSEWERYKVVNWGPPLHTHHFRFCCTLLFGHRGELTEENSRTMAVLRSIWFDPLAWLPQGKTVPISLWPLTVAIASATAMASKQPLRSKVASELNSEWPQLPMLPLFLGLWMPLRPKSKDNINCHSLISGAPLTKTCYDGGSYLWRFCSFLFLNATLGGVKKQIRNLLTKAFANGWNWS